MEHNENIGEVFKDAFDGFEADVPAGAWENIQSQMGQGAGGGASDGGASSSGFFGSTGFIAGASAVAGIAITTVVLSTMGGDDPVDQVAEETTAPVEETVTEIPDNSTILEEGLRIMDDPADAALVVDEDDPVIEEIIEIGNDNGGPTTIVVLDDEPVDNGSIVDNGPMGVSTLPSYPVSTDDSNEETQTTVVSEQSHVQNDGPVAQSSASADRLTGYAPLEVAFANDGEFTSIKWDFGDGTTSSLANPSHVFEQIGEYTVKVEVSNAYSTVVETVKITVEASSKITGMPNVFSPNGDGMNDKLVVKTERMEKFQLIVIDMNGQTIFESNSPDRHWNGTNAFGEPLPAGNYTYYVKAVGIDGKQHEEYQVVTLVR